MNFNKTPHGCLPLIILIIFLFLPFFMADIILNALAKLGLSPASAFIGAAGIFLGGMINIPVKKIPRGNSFQVSRQSMFGLDRFFPRGLRETNYTTIAVNLGGCVIPSLLVIYELYRVAGGGWAAVFAALFAISINIVVCNRLARLVPGVGITMNALVPAIAASLCGVFLMPELAPQIAFSAGVLGPLVGADLLHLKEIDQLNTSLASIGGAGTFDGIVLSGLIATLLA
ncbi:MAG: DUF1614 domain-containing protein [Calditrichia bacterium]